MPLHGTTTDWSQARDLSAEHPDKLHELQHLWLIEAFGGMGRLSESSVVNIKNKSHAVIAEVVVPSSGAEGVIVAQGDSIGGWSRDQVRMEFACDVGVEGGAVVSEDYGPRGNEFTGEVNWAQIDLDEAAEDLDHLITSEERLRIAMARQ